MYKAILPVRKRIEAWPGVTKTEMCWYRSKAGELEPAANRREPKACYYNACLPHHRSHLHTHILDKGSKEWGQSLPSMEDFKITALLLLGPNMRAWHVASITGDGEVAGYVSYFPTGKFRQIVREYGQLAPGVLQYSISAKEGKKYGLKEEVDFMVREKLVSLHITPMPGYKFDIVEGAFVKS